MERPVHDFKAATVRVNNSLYLSPASPFGGWRIIGVGVEHRVVGFREYLRVKTIASRAI